MTLGDALLIFAAGLAAGTVNTVVGSGSLITFPTLLAVGYPAVVANVSNNVGLVPGSLSGAVGYRRELAGQRDRIVKLGAASIAGGLTGAILLLALPGSVFKKVVPALILLACLLVAVQPWLSRLLAHFAWFQLRIAHALDAADRRIRRGIRCTGRGGLRRSAWPKAETAGPCRRWTACAPPCSAPSATICAPLWPRRPPRSAACAWPTSTSATRTAPSCSRPRIESLDRLRGLVENLLDMSRLQAGALAL